MTYKPNDEDERIIKENYRRQKMFRLTFSGKVIDFNKIGQVKAYLRHHRAIGNYTIEKEVDGNWIKWDVYRNAIAS